MTQTTVAYRYRAATTRGDEVRGVVRASSPSGAMEELRRQSLVPMEIAPDDGTRDGAAQGGGAGFTLTSGRAEARAIAMRTIATMVSAGATLHRALAFAGKNSTNEEMRHSIEALAGAVQRGASLSSALRSEERVWGSLAAAVAHAGEESGTLDDALSRLADHYDRANELRATLRQALWYPALMGVVAGVGVTILLMFVVPRFVAMLGETGQGAFPPSTRALIAMSRFVRTWWWAILLVLAGGWFWLVTWLRDAEHRRRFHAARLTWPLVGGVEREVCAARFARAFGTLLSGGVGVLGAIRIAATAVPNDSLQHQLEEAAETIGQGGAMTPAMEGILPPLATQLLSVGEESGGTALGAMALRVADHFDASTQRSMRGLVALVEPVLIIVFGGVVGFVALAMLQAVYAINGGIT